MAAKLGTELSTIGKVSDALLDFQSNIEAELDIERNIIEVTDGQLEYLQELVMFAYEMEVPEQKGWDYLVLHLPLVLY